MSSSRPELRLASRIRITAPSGTLAVSALARELARRGELVLSLSSGDPGFPTPSHIVAAAAEAIERGLTHYLPVRGYEPLRAAIAGKLLRENGVRVDPDREVCVLPSAKNAVYASVQVLVEAGDEVLIPTPSWVSYAPQVTLAGAVPVFVPLDPGDSWRLTRRALRARVTRRTRAIVLNSPGNPTGRVLTREELEDVATIADEYDLIVVSDEIYERIVYDGRQALSPASLPGMAERTLTVNGFSKAYAMTGWRLGYVAGPAPLIDAIVKLAEHCTGCAAAFVQAAGVTALEGDQSCVSDMVAEYARRRERVCAALNALPGVRCAWPEGAFYAFPEVGDGAEFAKRLLQEARVAVTPGGAFGPGGERHVRLTFAGDVQILEAALARIAEWVARRGG